MRTLALDPNYLSGVRGRVTGNISTYPDNGWVAAVVGQDLIQGSETWAGYFEGRGYFEDQIGVGTTNPIADIDVRGRNVFVSPDAGSFFPENFAAMGEPGGDCDLFGFRAQENFELFINMGIEDAMRPTISWGSSGDLELKCDANETGCGTKVASFSCPGMFTMRLNGPAVFSGGTYTPADDRLIRDTEVLDNSLELLQQLNAVRFSYDSEAMPDYRLSTNQQVGLVANEVAEVLPEAVQINDEGYAAINYDAFVPHLIEGVKELDQLQAADQQVIQAQALRIEELEQEMAELKSMVQQLVGNATNKGSAQTGDVSETPRLGQNTPNPFGSSTRIDYYVPMTTERASIEVTNLAGQVMNVYPVQAGEGQLKISGNTFPEGVYLYSLRLDGATVATQRMVISK